MSKRTHTDSRSQLSDQYQTEEDQLPHTKRIKSVPLTVEEIQTEVRQVADQTVIVHPMKSFLASDSFSHEDIKNWRSALQTDGYLYLRGLLPRSSVIHARNIVLEHMERRKLIHTRERRRDDTTTCYHARACNPIVSPNLLSELELHQHESLTSVLHHQRLVRLIREILGQMDPYDTTSSHVYEPVVPPQPDDAKHASASSGASPSLVDVWTSDYRWLRAVPKGMCTGLHLDKVYMQSNSTPLYSLWLPLGDLTPSEGNLVISPGSHRSSQFHRLRVEYGQSSVGAKGNGTTSGWIDTAEFTSETVDWVSSPVEAGDIVLLDLSVLHGTSINMTNDYRLSCDTRWCVTQRTSTDAQPIVPDATIKFHLVSE